LSGDKGGILSELLRAVLCTTVVHEYEQFLNLCLVRVRLVCIFVFFCVSLDHVSFALFHEKMFGLFEVILLHMYCVNIDYF